MSPFTIIYALCPKNSRRDYDADLNPRTNFHLFWVGLKSHVRLRSNFEYLWLVLGNFGEDHCFLICKWLLKVNFA